MLNPAHVATCLPEPIQDVQALLPPQLRVN